MIGIISVTKKGDILADKLKNNFNSEVFLKSKEDLDVKSVVSKYFEKFDGIIFISSTGIAIRMIANLLKGKTKDPAVVVVDVNNNFTISLLSGHLGGANELTLKVSNILKNTPVITTATDGMNIKAPDIIAKENGFIIDDFKICKNIASLLVNNKEVFINDEKNIIKNEKGYIDSENVDSNTILITNKNENYNKENVLKLIRRDVVLGIGCRKDTDPKNLEKFVLDTLNSNGYDYRSVCKIGSVDVKKEETAIIELSKRLNCDFVTFDRDSINSVKCDYEKSEFVFKTLGVYGVCEPVIYLMNSYITVKKIKFNGMTLAIGEIISEGE